jgi:CHAT domain-containing protein/tetratricopeptide (TPR) repeat protein
LVITTALVSTLILAACNPASQGRSENKLRSALEKNPADMDTRIELAKLLHEKGSHFDAVIVLEEGTKLDPDDPTFLKLLGETYADWAGQLDSAKKYEMAAQYWQQYIDLGATDAEGYRTLGDLLWNADRIQQAVEPYTKVLQLDANCALARARIGYVLTQNGEYEKAHAALTAAAEQLPQDFRIWWWLGDVQQLLGEYQAALTSMEKAMELCSDGERSNVQKHVRFTRGLVRESDGSRASRRHQILAERHQKSKRPDRAIAEYKIALEVNPEGRHADIGWYNLEIALCYAQVKEPEKAVNYGLRAVEAYEQANDPQRLAWCYHYLGIAYANAAKNDPTRRQELFEKALKAFELEEQTARHAGNDRLTSEALANMAKVLDDLHGASDPRFKEYRQTIVRHLPKSGAVTDHSAASLMRAEAEFRVDEGDYEGARILLEILEPYYSKSTDFGRMTGAPWIYRQLGYISWRQGDIDKAMMYGDKCVAKLTEMRSMLGVDEFRRRVGGERWQYAYSGLVAGALTKGEKARALDYAEQYKGRALLELLGSKAVDGKRSAVERNQEKGQTILAQVEDLEEQLQAARSGVNGENVRSLERTLSIEQTQYKRLAEDITAAELEVKSFEDVESMTTEQLRPVVDDFTLVSYVIGWWGLSTVLLSKEGVDGILTEDMTERKLRPLVDAFREEVGVKSAASRDLTLEVEQEKEPPEKLEKAASEQLYELLIEPVLPYIKTKLVYISPDGVLNYLPFEALQKDGRYLIEDYSIAYAPSGSVLKICMDRNRNRRESILALGNPNLKNPAFRLVHAENEVNSLEGLFPQVDVYTGDDATEAVVQQHGGEYDILHFACHGELNLDEPMLTSLRLAPDNENDGYLHAGEVFEHDLSASLVVLSACNSALGELTSGNELMGLTRSFLYAGVPSIVASLWTVDDRSTSYLMQHFYKNLATMNKADALREAKLETMKKYPSPFHWAAFCLQGDYR